MNYHRLYRQLLPLGEERAELVTALTQGALEELTGNPVLNAMRAPYMFLYVAAAYGMACRACTEIIEANTDPESVKSATVTLGLLKQIVVLTDAPDPDPQPQTLSELLRQMANKQTDELDDDDQEPVA